MRPTLQQLSILVVFLGTLASATLGNPVSKSKGPCNPQDCKLPDCRCWNDKNTPGNVTQPPQLIMLTFDYAFNKDNVDRYQQIFEGLYNPNGCRSKGTFFVQAYNSDVEGLQLLTKDKHELAINSYNGVSPLNTEQWKSNIKKVLALIEKSGVPASSVQGVRAPQLFSGGNSQFEAMQELGLKYDTSCVDVEHSDPEHLLWPYTLDNIDQLPSCSIGRDVNKTFPGIWEFPVPVLDYSGQQCPTPSGCLPLVNTTDGVFQLFFEAFKPHYFGNREPFVVDLDALWVTKSFAQYGTKEFLQLILTLPDSYVVTVSDALKWVQDPNNIDMGQFGCDESELEARRRSAQGQIKVVKN